MEKAIHLANQLKCHLHILYVGDRTFLQDSFSRIFSTRNKTDLKNKERIKTLKEQYTQLRNPGLKLYVHVPGGNLEIAIAKYAEQQNIDMILLCAEMGPWSFAGSRVTADKLADQCHCPVLFSHALPDLQDLKIIVLPVDDSLPVNKIRIAIYLAKQFNAVIHLLALERNAHFIDREKDYLTRTYMVLKESTDQPFLCHTVKERDLAKGAIHYARTVQAGLILAKPEPRTDLFAKWIIKYLPVFVRRQMTVPVITVA